MKKQYEMIRTYKEYEEKREALLDSLSVTDRTYYRKVKQHLEDLDRIAKSCSHDKTVTKEGKLEAWARYDAVYKEMVDLGERIGLIFLAKSFAYTQSILAKVKMAKRKFA